MLINICRNKRVFYVNLKQFLWKSPSFFFLRPRVQHFSDFVHPNDVSERFRHIKVSHTEHLDTIDPNLSFQTQSSSGINNSSENIKHKLNDYSLENVESALMQFVPEYISSAKHEGDDTFMTPGQAFFLENKEKLMETVKRRYLEEKRLLKEEFDGTEQDLESLLERDFNEESFGSYGTDEIPPRDKDYLWDYYESTVSVPRETIELTKGVMPTIQQIIQILEQEAMFEVFPVDMNKYGRRDQGLYVIVASGTTAVHCRLVLLPEKSLRRVGRMLYNIIKDLEIPFVSKVSYCCKSRTDEWIIAHLGPLSVHLMIRDVRKKYSLEDFWEESLSTRKDWSNELIPE